MKQLLTLDRTTILFDEFTINCLLEFTKKLLQTKQVKNKKGYYFKKSSSLPSSNLYLKSFLTGRYAYDEHDDIYNFYNFIIVSTEKISLNAFYNLLTELKDKKIYSLNSISLFDYLEISKNNVNDLEEINTIIDTLKFFKTLE